MLKKNSRFQMNDAMVNMSAVIQSNQIMLSSILLFLFWVWRDKYGIIRSAPQNILLCVGFT